MMVPSQPPLVSGVADELARRRSRWGVIAAILLFLYGAAILIYGILGLAFLPAILVGGVTIGRHTTLLKLLGWVLFNLSITAHGCAVIVAAVSFCRERWRRGVYTIAVGVIVPGLVFAATYIVFIAFGVAD